MKPLLCGWPGCDEAFADQGTRSKHRNKAHGSRTLRHQKSLENLRASIAIATPKIAATKVRSKATKETQTASVQGPSNGTLIRQPSAEAFVPATPMEVDGAPASRQSLSIDRSSFARPDAEDIFKRPPHLYLSQEALLSVVHTPRARPHEIAPAGQDQAQSSNQIPFPTQPTQDASYPQAQADVGHYPVAPTQQQQQHPHPGDINQQPSTTAHVHKHCQTCTCGSAFSHSHNHNHTAFSAPPTAVSFPGTNAQQYPQAYPPSTNYTQANPNGQLDSSQWGLQRRRSFASSVQPTNASDSFYAQSPVVTRQRAYSFHHPTHATQTVPLYSNRTEMHGRIADQQHQQNTSPATSTSFMPAQEESTPFNPYAMLPRESFVRRNSMSSMHSCESELTCMTDWDSQSVSSHHYGIETQPNVQLEVHPGSLSVQSGYASLPDTASTSSTVF